jgi:hypothetical protein
LQEYIAAKLLQTILLSLVVVVVDYQIAVMSLAVAVVLVDFEALSQILVEVAH